MPQLITTSPSLLPELVTAVYYILTVFWEYKYAATPSLVFNEDPLAPVGAAHLQAEGEACDHIFAIRRVIPF